MVIYEAVALENSLNNVNIYINKIFRSMFETVYDGDIFQMLVTDPFHRKSRRH